MTGPERRRRQAIGLLAALALGARAQAADADVDALFASLAQPVPSATVFVERRESALLDAPLELHGELRRPEAGTLVRAVAQPFVETTTIRDQRVTVERAGERTRRFSLRRAPELAALLAGFRAMLDGDRSLLDPYYRLELSREPARWRLALTPIEPRLARRIAGLLLTGHEAQLDCVTVHEAGGTTSRMLVGAAAAAPQPDFGRCASD